MQKDENLFSELYRPIEDCGASDDAAPKTHKEVQKRGSHGFDIKRLLHGIDVEKTGILPLVLLLLLMLDADDEEKMIIIALAVIFGI